MTISSSAPVPSSSSSWWKNLLSPLFGDNSKSSDNAPGKVWSADAAGTAFSRGDMISKEGGAAVRVAFRNQSKLPLILSWISENGQCHHFYSLKPSQMLMEAPVTALDHVENTCVGHSFCIAHVGADEERVKKDKKLEPRFVVGGYRPTRAIEVNEDNRDQYVHLVTISRQTPTKEVMCCGSGGPFLRNNKQQVVPVSNDDDDDNLCWVVTAIESKVDDNQINTEDKVYEKSTLGGWPVCIEPHCFDDDKELEKRIAQDLEFAVSRLPEHARDRLRQKTPVFINKTLQYGPQACPINGRGLCFHGERKWLEEHFMCTDKHQAVELYNAKEYWDDCKLWGRGGVLVHEFSHAYHHICVENGFDNKEILECFEAAMKDRLYDWVRVHGTQGPMNKAYACNNCMEYFAELSAAFLGQPDLHASEEYNKWFPFNRRHIKEHDPRAYEMLKKIWKVDD
ncbi:expressed unknown protein [Seminavis robusta]|uniref:Uncharacterized protein n=1 Tax=Seminavis robusta TaxID=568900 RepID=A0A9N8DKB3_9STRA|nr:expressed unknown protein [Seminavis robusta]|eukprot:Sro127_g060920.1 n/a (453) ;mRNA; f:81024-82570